MASKKIKSALISVFYKDNLEPIVQLLQQAGVDIYSTGGTQQFLEGLGTKVTAIEELTDYPAILGGRVKTLHPKVFGGILARRSNEDDTKQIETYHIPLFDLVIVDLYPFEETLASGADEQAIIEKIDIGGISLIRAAAKNFADVLIVSSRDQYQEVQQLLQEKNGSTDLIDRKKFAVKAFNITSHYDTAIFNWFNKEGQERVLKQSEIKHRILRYGENPHQEGVYFGSLDDMFDQFNGKELSYNNLVDIDAAVSLMEEFDTEIAFAILKHTNACGVATGNTVLEAYEKALAADPVSAFGGVLITNTEVDTPAAEKLHELFFEVLIAPGYHPEALEILKQKKNRILLLQKEGLKSTKQHKSLLNGTVWQDRDLHTDEASGFRPVTKRIVTEDEKAALVFAGKIAKHTKSNTIVLAKKGQLLASGVGQTSRVDALRQAIEKAKSFGFDLKGAVMASDAFFPFPDCVEIAHGEGIDTIIQPGGSIKDQDSIDFCDRNNMAMVFTGVRHFKH